MKPGNITAISFLQDDFFIGRMIADLPLIIHSFLIIKTFPVIFIINKGILLISFVDVQKKCICWLFRSILY